MNDVPTLERTIALKAARARLETKFAHLLEPTTIASFLDNSYDRLMEGAKVTRFVPVLAERYAEQRLSALARAEGHDADTPLVLFVCGNNSGRSQMAVGFVDQLSDHRVAAWAGGTKPAADVNEHVVAVMAEDGIDIRDEMPNPWTDEIVHAADAIVTLGEIELPARQGQRLETWDVPHVTGLSLDGVRNVRDDIKARVRILLDDLMPKSLAI